MREHRPRTRFPAVLAVPLLLALLTLAASACGSSPAPGSSGAGPSPRRAGAGSFPTSIDASNGTVHIGRRPSAIVSLSPTATEMLYAIGAGRQVKAVDQDSDYPRGVPRTALDGFQPNVEAIAAYRPDLVVVAGDSTGLTGRMAVLGIPVLSEPAATTVTDVYNQLDQLGAATGHVSQAAAEVASIKASITRIVRSVPRSHGVRTYYYELDPTYDSATSSTFIGRLLGLLGLTDIADRAPGATAAGGYPQLSAEFVVRADPDYVFLADTVCCGQGPRSVAARPGWSAMTAVVQGHVVGLNDDVASRWGPRIVDLLRTVAAALIGHGGASP